MNVPITGNGVYQLGKVKGKVFYDLFVAKSCSVLLEFEFNGEWIPNYQGTQNISSISAPYFGKIVVPAGVESARATISDFDSAFELVFEESIAASLPSPSTDILLDDIKELLQTIDAVADSLSSLFVANRLQVEILGRLGVSRSLSVTSTSAEISLTTTCRRVRVTAVSADICFRVGTGTIGSAVTTDHYLVSGTSADFTVAESSKIAAIRAGSTDGTLRISELLATE